MYEKKGILLPSKEQNVEFSLLHTPKLVTDVLVLFPSATCIPDAMLQRIDPTNPILVQYLTYVNPNVSVRVLFPKGAKGTSKADKASKKS